MSAKNNPEAGPDDSEEPDVSAEDVRDLFLDEERLDVSTISEEFEIDEETAEEHLDRLVQSGIVEKNARSPVRGGTEWVLKNPQLRVRSADEVAGESPLSHKASLSGEPRDEEVSIEDVLGLLADYEDRIEELSTTKLATRLQITTRRSRDLLDSLADREIAEKQSPDGSGADEYWLSEKYTTDDVAELLGDPDPEPSPVDKLDKALSD